MRPMAGKPLIYYSITECLKTSAVDKLVVSTDDEEISYLAKSFGAEVVMRPSTLADDLTTLDPVIAHALAWCENQYSTTYDIVITVQPTSPLIGSKNIGDALEILNTSQHDSVLSVVDDRHLCWTVRDGKAVPDYAKRVNRQLLPPRFRETGAIIACRRELLVENRSRIGKNVALLEIEQEKSFDIDTINDFKLCENLLLRKKIAFNVIGNSTVGMGHVYRALMIANELVGHSLVFVATTEDTLALELIREKNFEVVACDRSDLASQLISLTPDMVINDVLDTSSQFIRELKSNGISVVNFEDLGPGIEQADLVINALYPAAGTRENIRYGSDYFCLRDEFIHTQILAESERQNEVLLCFGGVDEGNITIKVLLAIHDACRALGFHITIVIGSGYQYTELLNESLEQLDGGIVEVASNTSAIAEYMRRAKLAFTSGGRTVFELAALATPSIVICQNDREMTHNFAFDNKGIISLGHRDAVSEAAIRESFKKVATELDTRVKMSEALSSQDFSKGKRRVKSMIKDILDARDEENI